MTSWRENKLCFSSTVGGKRCVWGQNSAAFFLSSASWKSVEVAPEKLLTQLVILCWWRTDSLLDVKESKAGIMFVYHALTGLNNLVILSNWGCRNAACLQSPLCWVWLLRPTTNNKPCEGMQTSRLRVLPWWRRCGRGDAWRAWPWVWCARTAGCPSETWPPCRGRCQRARPGGWAGARLSSLWTYLAGQGWRLNVRRYVHEQKPTRCQRCWFETCSVLSCDGWDSG